MNYKITDRELIKIRTGGTISMILRDLEGLDLASLLADIFVHTDNALAKELIRRYEAQIVLAYENPDKFEDGLHKFFVDTNNYIKENNLYREFMSFYYFIFSTFAVKGTLAQNKSVYVYYDLLSQQLQYFTPQLSKIMAGINSKGKPLLINDVFPYVDVPRILINRIKNGTFLDDIRLHKMYGYNISSPKDVIRISSNDQLITNSVMVMASFITEETRHIVPKDFYMPTDGIDLPIYTVQTNIYKELLKEKRYFLPKNGVKAIYKNTRDIQEIYFQEIFWENRIMLLYKVTVKNGKEFYGFYDNKLQLFYSPFSELSIHKYEQRLENLILETYSYLTTNIEENEIIEKRINLVDDFDIEDRKTLFVKFEYEYVQDTLNDITSEKRYRAFRKKDYEEEVKYIQPFKRKLPEGAKVSEEAIQIAREYGYILFEGETFVRPFDKKIYSKKDSQ